MPKTDKTPCVWAADLLERLEESGTPADKLKEVRDAMAARWNATAKLAPTTRRTTCPPPRPCSSSKRGSVPTTERRRRRARSSSRGYLEAPKPPVHPSELIPAPPRDKRPVEAEAAPAETKPRSIAGVQDLGVHDIPTVGPKPVAGAKGKEKAAKPGKDKGAKTTGAKGKPPVGFKELVPATPPAPPAPEITTPEPPAE